MIKRKNSKVEQHVYDNALISLKYILDDKYENKYIQEQRETKERLTQAFINVKRNKIIQIFTQKLRRGIVMRTPPESLKQKWQKQIVKTGVEGISYHQNFWYLISFLHIFALVLILIISSFCGFIDLFSQNNSTYAGVIVTKALCLAVFIVYFFVFCTRKVYYKGVDKIFLKQIIKAYAVSFRMFLDLATIILTILTLALPMIQGVAMALFFVAIFTLVFSLTDLVQFQMILFRSKTQRLIWSLVKVGIFNILFAHCLGTVLLGMSKYDQNNNWLLGYHGTLDQLNWFDIYVSSYYWATTIMMTVGFGDFLPVTTQESITVAFIEIFSCIVLAYNISEIGNIISTLRQKNERLTVRTGLFQRIVARNKKKFKGGYVTGGLDDLLQKRIYNYITEEENDGNEYLYLTEQEQLIESLPQNLRMAFYQQTYTPVLKQLIFFSTLKPQTLQSLSQVMQNKYYYPGKLFGAQRTQDVLILERGKVGLTYNKFGATINGTIIQRLQSSSNTLPVLLSTNFLSLQNNTFYDIISQSYCHVWVIQKQAFLQVLSKSNIDNQFYFSLQHKLHLSENPYGVTKCSRCLDMMHTSFQCPRIHYIPLKSQVIDKNLKLPGKDQDRQRYYRKNRNRHTHQSLMNKKKLIEISQQFYKQQADQIEEYEMAELLFDKQERQSQDIKRKLLVQRLNEQKFENLMQNAIRNYDLGYQEEFWRLQCDQAENYQFYFPLSNPNRLNFTALNGIPFIYQTTFSTQKKKKGKNVPNRLTTVKGPKKNYNLR